MSCAKLYLRLAKSYLKLGQPARARPALLIAKNLLKEHGDAKEAEVAEIDALLKKCDSSPTTASKSEVLFLIRGQKSVVRY